jgi:hypothetical protein
MDKDQQQTTNKPAREHHQDAPEDLEDGHARKDCRQLQRPALGPHGDEGRERRHGRSEKENGHGQRAHKPRPRQRRPLELARRGNALLERLLPHKGLDGLDARQDLAEEAHALVGDERGAPPGLPHLPAAPYLKRHDPNRGDATD